MKACYKNLKYSTQFKVSSFSNETMTYLFKIARRAMLLSYLNVFSSTSNDHVLALLKKSQLPFNDKYVEHHLLTQNKVTQKCKLLYIPIKNYHIPTSIKKITLQKSAFVNKKARSQFELRTQKAGCFFAPRLPSEFNNFTLLYNNLKKGSLINAKLTFLKLKSHFYELKRI